MQVVQEPKTFQKVWKSFLVFKLRSLVFLLIPYQQLLTIRANFPLCHAVYLPYLIYLIQGSPHCNVHT